MSEVFAEPPSGLEFDGHKSRSAVAKIMGHVDKSSLWLMEISVLSTLGEAEPGMNDSNGSADKAGQLRGWKEIGRWFGVDERTVKRWETSRALPVYRVPGKPRAPVYAYSGELTTWMAAQHAPAFETQVERSAHWRQIAQRHRWAIIAIAIATVVLVAALVASRQSAPLTTASDNRVRRLAGGTLAEVNARLEHQPRTVQLRASLAEEAAAALKDLAAQPSATPDLRREAAIAYRRLATISSSNDRPSLLDRGGARTALANALKLVNQDSSGAGRRLRALLLIDASRQAAADGALDQAQNFLNSAAALNASNVNADVRQEWDLASSEIAQWQGKYFHAISLAQQSIFATDGGADPDQAFRSLRAAEPDIGSEILFRRCGRCVTWLSTSCPFGVPRRCTLAERHPVDLVCWSRRMECWQHAGRNGSGHRGSGNPCKGSRALGSTFPR